MLAKPWWWLLASIAHFLLHHGFTTKHTDGLVCLPPSNRAVRVKSEASKSKDTYRSTAITAALAAAHGHHTAAAAEATAAVALPIVGESDFSSTLDSMYCPAFPAGTAKARSLQNRSNNLVRTNVFAHVPVTYILGQISGLFCPLEPQQASGRI